MSALPTKRLLVYAAAGLVVLVVGTVGLVSLGGGAGDGEGVLIDAGAGGDAADAGDAAPGGLAGYQGSGAGGAGGGPLSAGASGLGSTTTTEAPKIWVQVVGAVRLQGVYRLSAGARVFQAVDEAGGFTEEADQQAVALAAELSDGCRVYVPKVGEASAGAVTNPVMSFAGVTAGPEAEGESSGAVSLNGATAEELDTLPGIGPSLAQQIVAYRQVRGPFTSIDQLTDVPGIGPAKLEQLRPLVVL